MKTHFVEYRNGYRVYVTADEVREAFKHKRKPIRTGTLKALKERLASRSQRAWGKLSTDSA